MKATAADRRVNPDRRKSGTRAGETVHSVTGLPTEGKEELLRTLEIRTKELEAENGGLRRSLETLEASRERYAELYELSPAAYFVFGKNGAILDLNRTAADLLGQEKRLLLERPFESFIPNPSDRARFKKELGEGLLLDTGKSVEIVLRKKDGVFDARVQFVPARERENRAECCKAVVIDITERRQLERELKDSEKRYRLLFDKSPLPKWVVDLEQLAFLEVNEAAVEHYGYKREEFLSMTLESVLAAGELERFRRSLEERGEASRKFEGLIRTRHRKKNGEIIDLDVRTTGIVYNRKEAALSVMVDVTERMQAEEELRRTVVELERSNSELQQFAYVASHDLQEPLRTVASYVDLLSMKYKGKLDEKADRYISYAVEGSNRMSALINDLLAYSRVGTRGNPFARVEMGSVLKKAMINLKRTIAESGAAIESEALPAVTGDETQLVQLLQNLISNAIKFTKKGVSPRIGISAREAPGETAFGVRDNGIGIEPRFYERIFVIFQRLHTREEYAGTGVGLAICKRIVERHGGRIWVESTPGEGSTFSFTLRPGGRM